MARCSHCNKWIVRGIREGQQRFCRTRCLEQALCGLVEDVDDDWLADLVNQQRSRICPLCRKRTPCDIYVQHTATSFVIHFSWKDSPVICCRRCGIGHVCVGIVWTLLLGWWHFPLGIIITFWQAGNGVRELLSLPSAGEPSPALTTMVKLELARRVLARDRQ